MKMKKKKLCDICVPKQWKTIAIKQLKDTGFPVYGANGVVGYWDTYNHEIDTLLIGCRGTCGTISIARGKSYVNGNAMCLDKLSNEVELKYLYHFLKAYDFKNVISGSTIPQITIEGLQKVDVVIPAKEKQFEIISTFDKLEQCIENKKRQLVLLDELVRARFVELFGDPTDIRLNRVPLGEYVENTKYGTSQPPQFDENGCFKFIRATNIKNGHIIEKDMLFISKAESEKINKCKLNGGELIIVRSGANTGDTCVITDDYKGQYAGYDIIVTLKTDKLNPVFLNELINIPQYMKTVVKPLTARSAQPHLNTQQVQSLPILVVDVDKQNQFAAFVEQTDKSKLAVQKSLSELETLKKALMQKYFGT